MKSNPQPHQQHATESTSLLQLEVAPRNLLGARLTVLNFVVFAFLASTNVCCVLACMALATARLGAIGATQSGVLYLSYTLSALVGATYVVKRLGARNGIVLGMSLYCVYVLSFTLAVLAGSDPSARTWIVLLGATIGGIGGGVFWTSQGAYFAQAAEEHSLFSGSCDWASSTSLLAGIFAAIYLTEEAFLHLVSSILAQRDKAWSRIFGVYAAIAVLSTLGMMTCVKNYPPASSIGRGNESVWYKLTAALQLLRDDSKMKYMIGLNAAFGFSGAFLNSFVSGQAVRIVLHDDNSKYVGGFAALCAIVAAACSLWFHYYLVKRFGKGAVLMVGASAFSCVALPFVLLPDLDRWSLGGLLLVYSLQGVGRATFESTLKSVFVDYFAYEKEGAFANIEFQNGLSSALGYMLSYRVTCQSPSTTYCIAFRDGSLHNTLVLELIVILTGMAAILGFRRASVLFTKEDLSGQATRLSSYRRDSLRSYRSSMSRMSGHMDDATFAAFEEFE